MAHDWKSYFCNVNDCLASIFLNLALKNEAPIPRKNWLLWVWLYFNAPRPDGLSSSDEAPVLFDIENKLTREMELRCAAVLSGRITTAGRREFYYYGDGHAGLQDCVSSVERQFQGYRFDCGFQEDREWKQYLDVLYPSDEDLQRIKNRDVLDVLGEKGDIPAIEREVSHWAYFQTEPERDAFVNDAVKMGYRIDQYSNADGPRPFGVVVSRHQAATPEMIDKAVIELFRLAQRHQAEYDGWETSVEKG